MAAAPTGDVEWVPNSHDSACSREKSVAMPSPRCESAAASTDIFSSRNCCSSMQLRKAVKQPSLSGCPSVCEKSSRSSSSSENPALNFAITRSASPLNERAESGCSEDDGDTNEIRASTGLPMLRATASARTSSSLAVGGPRRER